MKCFTDSAIELTWPGVPVTACASMRPCRSNTPAERSPHSRTIGENAVRISTCACSSTTAMSRFHMICRSMSVVAEVMGAPLSSRKPPTGPAEGRPDDRLAAGYRGTHPTLQARERPG